MAGTGWGRRRRPFAATAGRPPRWTVPLVDARLRVGIGLAVCVGAAALLAVVAAGRANAWLPLVAVLGVAASTLVHEGAHAWAAHALGYRVEWVVLGGFTGVTAYEGRDDRPLERAAVALAGPAATAAVVLGQSD
jgi:hypothetical protein